LTTGSILGPKCGSYSFARKFEPLVLLPVTSPQGLPTVDSLQIQLVLANLPENALQSVCTSHRHGKRVSVDACPINDQEARVSVTDRGPGVPPERAAEIFEPLHSGTSGGMGMGLAISQAIIHAHGGRLWYQPNPVGGAIFRFTLRIARP